MSTLKANHNHHWISASNVDFAKYDKTFCTVTINLVFSGLISSGSADPFVSYASPHRVWKTGRNNLWSERYWKYTGLSSKRSSHHMSDWEWKEVKVETRWNCYYIHLRTCQKAVRRTVMSIYIENPVLVSQTSHDIVTELDATKANNEKQLCLGSLLTWFGFMGPQQKRQQKIHLPTPNTTTLSINNYIITIIIYEPRLWHTHYHHTWNHCDQTLMFDSVTFLN